VGTARHLIQQTCCFVWGRAVPAPIQGREARQNVRESSLRPHRRSSRLFLWLQLWRPRSEFQPVQIHQQSKEYTTADPGRGSASRSVEPTVAVELQPMEADCPGSTASRQRRLTTRRLGECCPALLVQPSLRDGRPSWNFTPGAEATGLPSRQRYAVIAQWARRRSLSCNSLRPSPKTLLLRLRNRVY
jgi:hypothetical protein